MFTDVGGSGGGAAALWQCVTVDGQTPLQSPSHLESTRRLADRRSDPYALSHTHTHTHTHIPQVFTMMVNSLVENVHQNTPEHVLVLSKRP